MRIPSKGYSVEIDSLSPRTSIKYVPETTNYANIKYLSYIFITRTLRDGHILYTHIKHPPRISIKATLFLARAYVYMYIYLYLRKIYIFLIYFCRASHNVDRYTLRLSIVGEFTVRYAKYVCEYNVEISRRDFEKKKKKDRRSLTNSRNLFLASQNTRMLETRLNLTSNWGRLEGPNITAFAGQRARLFPRLGKEKGTRCASAPRALPRGAL